MALKFRFVGADGTFLPGVPARDLADDDVATLTEEQRAAVAANAAGEPAGRIYEAAAGKAKVATGDGA